MIKYILYIFVLISVVSCIPDENPVKAYDRGGILSSKVTLGPNYTEQVFFSFDQNKYLLTNEIYAWDIAFSCKDSSNDIVLNTSKFMKIADMGFKAFADITTTDLNALTEEQWIFDRPSGNLDSAAFHNWWEVKDGKVISLGKVYIVDRGTNEIGKKLGNVKFQILDYDYKTYKVVYANLKDNVSHEYTITKDNLYNYTYLSFEKTGKTLQIEPPKATWDVVFTKYTELLYTSLGDSMWYSVVGAYLNPNGGEGAMIRHADFATIDARVLDTIKLSKNTNSVGHDWKYFDLNANTYKVTPDIIYIVKGISGFYYKLHFMDFYDDSGNKGTPLFEFQKL